MGAPKSGLLPVEARAVKRLAANGGNKTEALRYAGDSDPHAHAPRVFGRPRVQKAIREILGTSKIRNLRKSVYLDGLQITDPDNPVAAQRERRHTANDIGRILGDYNDANVEHTEINHIFFAAVIERSNQLPPSRENA
jgi:hypothetical protein